LDDVAAAHVDGEKLRVGLALPFAHRR